jgi:hypothetical protein
LSGEGGQRKPEIHVSVLAAISIPFRALCFKSGVNAAAASKNKEKGKVFLCGILKAIRQRE